jgi:hypothetical protein
VRPACFLGIMLIHLKSMAYSWFDFVVAQAGLTGVLFSGLQELCITTHDCVEMA